MGMRPRSICYYEDLNEIGGFDCGIFDFSVGGKGCVGVHLSGASLTNTCSELEWLKLCK